ncbi:putative protein kinase RLK-Pelle-LRR-Xb-1 family [Helianthus annuus]|nr:putative protein kinase RLK-Pelle-LRR-Xb-1 family [Helianthus annuus]
MAMNSNLQAILSAVASFFLLSLIFTFIYFVCRTATKRRRDSAHRRRTRSIRRPPDLPTSTSFISVAESQMFDPNLKEIDMVDLVNATRNFSPDLIVGDGSFGLVYKANLPSGGTVAVKKLSADAFQGYREFKAEMDTLGKIQHDNIVRFFGYCATGSDRILIYEFIEKGSLDQWLYDTSSMNNDASGSRVPLSWNTRIKIIIGVAKGLAYMHNLSEPIIHRDIKASNVLLDADFKAHIADFGLARTIKGEHLHVSTQVAGTMGICRQSIFMGRLRLLLWETRPNWPIKGENGEEIRLVEWATRMVSQNREIKMLDASISKEDLKEKEVLEFFRIATLCTKEVHKERPNMNRVVELLNQIQDEPTI